MTTITTSLFRHEYRQELEEWLRRRFQMLCICYFGFAVVMLLVIPFTWGAQSLTSNLIETAIRIVNLGIVAAFLFGFEWREAQRSELLRAASRMILLIGSVPLAGMIAIRLLDPGASTPLLLPLFLLHFCACLLLPWTPRESLKPVVPLFIVWALVSLLWPGTDLSRAAVRVMFGPAIFLPGLAIAAFRWERHSRDFRTRMIGKHYTSLRQEMSRARSIHDAMFPSPYDDGYIRFDYHYEPAREIGGDFIHLRVSPAGLLHLALLDVTGHGLAAALTVNRLYGELERIRAESEAASPADVLRLLNRYIHLTLVQHNIFATAICLSFDPYSGTLTWASGGHPPAFARTAQGEIKDLAANAVVLGALDDDEFRIEDQTITLAPGDFVLVYTDGAFESTDRHGKQFGLTHLRNLLRNEPPPRHLPRYVASAVRKHAAGRLEDDVLVGVVGFAGSRASG